MKITKQNLRTYSERFLEVLDEEKISSLEEVFNATGKIFKVREILSDIVSIHLGPSNNGTTALKVSYICPDFEGIPIELVINSVLKYRKTILKCIEKVSGYTFFAKDKYGNFMQFKKVNGAEWADAIKDLEALRK